MIACEIIMLAALLTLAVYAAYKDCNTSQIPNRLLLAFALLALVLDTLYYAVWAGKWFQSFIVNTAFLSGTSLLLYAYHLWAAGDSKLLIVLALFLPGRFLASQQFGAVPGFVILALAFIIAFLYVIAESVLLALRKGSLNCHPMLSGFEWKSWLASYVFMAAALSLASVLLSQLFPHLYSGSPIQRMAIHFLLILTMLQLRSYLPQKLMIIIAVFLWIILVLLSALGRQSLPLSFQWRAWALLFGMLILLHFAQQFNYRTIPTIEVQQGQILSAATVLSFRSSRVKGLPSTATEDLRARLSAEEAESVRRWATSSKGKTEITIVRKIPFAAFIGIGAVLFVLMEVLLQ